MPLSTLDHRSSTHKQSTTDIHEANKITIRTVHQQIKNEMKYLKTEPTFRYDHIDTKITKIEAKTTKLRIYGDFL